MARVLLLGPWTMPQVALWRRVLADVAGSCTLATLHPGPVAEEDAADTVDLRDGRSFATAFVRAIGELRRMDRERGYDAVLAYYVTSYGSMAALAFPGRFTAVAAGSDIDPTRMRAIRRAVARFALGRAARAVAWTPVMAERMLELGVRADAIRTGPRGIDLGTYRPAAAGPPEEGPISIVTTRRLRPVFRHDVLLEALRRLTGRGIAARVDFVGSGTERARLEALATELALADRVRFWGSLPAAAVADRLRDAGVFVTLSTKDGLSTSLVEAMACGTVPVVSDIAPNRELVRHKVDGVVVRGNDPDEVADALLLAARDRVFRASAIAGNVARIREAFDIRRNTEAILRFAGLGDLAPKGLLPEDDDVNRVERP